MPEITQRPVWALAAAQVTAVWAVGAGALPMVLAAGLFAIFGGPIYLLGVLLAGTLIVAMLLATINATRAACVLGSSRTGRALWVLLVVGVGAVLWRLGWLVSDAVGLTISTRQGLSMLVGGVPFALVALLLARPWQLRLIACAALLAAVAGGLAALEHAGPDELTLRLRSANLDRGDAYIFEIPGYRRVGPSDGRMFGENTFVPSDLAAGQRDITVTARPHPASAPGTCDQTAGDGPLAGTDCIVESAGLSYRRGVAHHGYQVQRGPVVIEVVGGIAVERQTLRDAAGSAQVAPIGEIQTGAGDPSRPYLTEIPGYTLLSSSPSGMTFRPVDPPLSEVAVRTRVDHLDWSQVCAAAERRAESADLVYCRFPEAEIHGYVLRRGGVNVAVTGGLGVDPALLRGAALAARPATDQELTRSLPPATPNGLTDRLRQWLRRWP